MQTVQEIKGKIKSTEDLGSVVKTMKSLAAVNIRQYEKAVEALEDYVRTIELGLGVVAGQEAAFKAAGKEGADSPVAAIVIGSDLGMCGQLNEEAVSHFMEETGPMRSAGGDVRAMVVGERVAVALDERGAAIEGIHSVPGGVSGIRPLAQRLLLGLDKMRSERDIGSVWVFYNERSGKASFGPVSKRLLPADRQWLQSLTERGWPGRTLPMFTMDPGQLLSDLLRQYLFGGLYRAVAESLASENSARLMAMQRAEDNILDLLDELTNQYHQQRQMNITQEILEVISGFEALK